MRLSKIYRFPDPIPKEKKIQNVSPSKSFKVKNFIFIVVVILKSLFIFLLTLFTLFI